MNKDLRNFILGFAFGGVMSVVGVFLAYSLLFSGSWSEYLLTALYPLIALVMWADIEINFLQGSPEFFSYLLAFLGVAIWYALVFVIVGKLWRKFKK